MTTDNTKIFDALEKKIEKVLDRYRASVDEAGRLKARLAEREAELEKAKQELAAARKASQKSEELAAEMQKHEDERQKVRERLSRLIQTLEAIDADAS
jgi:hypothetical protein